MSTVSESPMLLIHITLMRIRIRLSSLMRIRSLLFTLMQIRILLFTLKRIRIRIQAPHESETNLQPLAYRSSAALLYYESQAKL
jgi:hypothetical protein